MKLRAPQLQCAPNGRHYFIHFKQEHAFHESRPLTVAEIEVARVTGNVLPERRMSFRLPVREPDILFTGPEKSYRWHAKGRHDVHGSRIIGYEHVAMREDRRRVPQRKNRDIDDR